MSYSFENSTTRTNALLALFLAVAIFGATHLLRGPNLFAGPVMAEMAVEMPDGNMLYVQKYEVTVSEWNICNISGGCSLRLRATDNAVSSTLPATGISFADATEYIEWINDETGKSFRLPKIDEWEFLASGIMPIKPDPIFTDPKLSWASAYLIEPQTARTLRPSGSFSTTSHGISDFDGSVWEWTQDCYAGAGGQISKERCPAYLVGGEHIAAISFLVRDPARGGCAVGAPPAHLGMRLVSDEPV